MNRKIIGTGSYLPANLVTNEQLAKSINTSDEWIISRTGIKQRYIADETSSFMGYQAALNAIQNSNIDKNEIDLIIVATTTPDKTFPSTACIIQELLGIEGNTAAFDVQAVCAGFAYGFAIADSMIFSGNSKCALVIGVDKMSSIIDWSDRKTCVLFGDGAGAVIMKPSESQGIIGSKLYADGSLGDILYAEKEGYLVMQGAEVFKNAVEKISSTIVELLAAYNIDISDVDHFIPHQANIRILEAVAKKLEIADSKVVITVDKHANTSAASIPLALDDAVRSGLIKKGELVLSVAIGGGMCWGGNLFRL